MTEEQELEILDALMQARICLRDSMRWLTSLQADLAAAGLLDPTRQAAIGALNGKSQRTVDALWEASYAIAEQP